MAQSLIILGAGTRAAARSARRAGLDPVCIDVWNRRDLRALARVSLCPVQQFPAGILGLLKSLPVAHNAPVLFTRPLENHPQLLEAIAFERELLGSKPAAVRHVRDPQALSHLPTHPGLRFCKVRSHASLMTRAGQKLAAMMGGKGYLIKPRAGVGGRNVAHWSPVQSVGRDKYLQQYISGMPMSAVFVADGWSAHLVGATEQLIGEPAFGAAGFRYVGNMGPMQLGDKPRKALMHLGVVLAQRFDLRGLFGVDAVMDFAGDIWPVEVNPRYTESVELLEESQGLSLLAGPTMGDIATPRKGRGAARTASTLGKAVVYARQAILAPDLDALLGDQAADAAEPGQKIAESEPICTVFAAAPTRDACLAMLRQRADVVYANAQASP
jgi:predicted ATP-grasp superfamily ATP-dependent carboligase